MINDARISLETFVFLSTPPNIPPDPYWRVTFSAKEVPLPYDIEALVLYE